MTFDIDLPEEIDDETAAVLVDFLYALGDAFCNRYYSQIRRFYDDRREPPPPPTDEQQLLLFPKLDIPF